MLKLKQHEVDFIAASGSLGLDGNGYWWEQPFRWLGLLDPSAFTIITKTLTRHPREGNLKMWCPWRCVRLVPGGTINSVGLTNPGIQDWISEHYPMARDQGYKMIASLAPETEDEVRHMCDLVNNLHLVGIELNMSCPNVSHASESIDRLCRLTEVAVKSSEHPVILKLGLYDHYYEVCRNLDGQVAAFDLINAVPWKRLRLDPSPLSKYDLQGALSGKPITLCSRVALKMALDVAKKTPIISGGGVYSFEEAVTRFKLGAAAVSFGTVFLRAPWRANRIVNRWRKENARV